MHKIKTESSYVCDKCKIEIDAEYMPLGWTAVSFNCYMSTTFDSVKHLHLCKFCFAEFSNFLEGP